MPNKMIPPRRVKIAESKYIEERDLILWKLVFQDDGMEQSYVWPSIDLMKALNITAKVTPDLIHKFCKDIEGKEINFVIDEEPKLPEVEITRKQNDKLFDDIREHFDVFRREVEGE